MIERSFDKDNLRELMEVFPVTAILGPRQSGKTTLSREFSADHRFDLENPRDASLFSDPQLALEPLSGLIIIDEVQRAPQLFSLLRYMVDHRPDQRYLLLGSASPGLIRQSSESLAGRIGYYELSGFRLQDVGVDQWRTLWMRGGYPKSFTALSEKHSHLWLEQYIATFLERDIPQLGITIPATTLRRFWTMLCHYHGQVINYAEFARSFGVSDMTVRKYLDILEGVFMVRRVQPWHQNLGKRLVKSPKMYLRDSGIYHHLLSIRNVSELTTHPKLGASWEGFALECCIRTLDMRAEEFYFWQTHSGAEVDLFWQDHGKNYAIEVKYSSAPKLTKSMKSAFADLNLDHLWVIYPGDRSYPLHPSISTLPIQKIEQIKAD
jgi:predicted AAA+ superfamily ATPase